MTRPDDPAAPDEQPAAPDELPAAPDEIPATPSEVPTAPDEVPAAPSEIPAAPGEVPATPDEVPATPDEVPATPNEVPATPDEVPAAPLEMTAAPLEMSAAPDEGPAVPNEVPAAPNEVPSHPDDAPVAPIEAAAVPGSRAPTAPPASRAPTAPPAPPAALDAERPVVRDPWPPAGGFVPHATQRDELEDLAPVTREPPRALGIALALVAAGCLIAACFSHRWLANRHYGNFGYSPLSFQTCLATCSSITNFQVAERTNDLPFAEDRVSMAFPVSGLCTFIVLLLAATGLLVASALAAGGRRPELPISPTTLALLGLMIGLISGCIFVATKPGGVGAVGVAWSFWAFGVGCVAGIAGAQLLAKQIRPPDPDLLHDAMNPDQF